MSSLGYQAIYRAWNAVEGAFCDRAFLPDDAEQVERLRGARKRLAGFSTGRPAASFDLLGISLAYELELPGVITCLELAGLAPLAKDRDRRDPPVVLGGPLTFSNPLPSYPFADVVVLGEGEAVAAELLETWLAAPHKDEFLEAVRGLAGIVVPSLDGPVVRPLARATDAQLPARSAFITPNTELSEMYLIEPERGCHRPCTYCVMRRPASRDALLAGGGMRLVSPRGVLDRVPAEARRVGLVGAAVTDHPQIKGIMKALVESGREIGISSLRADRLDDEFAALLRAGGYRTLTTAADGASERLRKEIKRQTKSKHLLRAAELVRDHGFRALKLYMMLGLPGEADGDIEELAEFSLELRAIARVSLSIAPFVSKRNTPLDALPYAGVKVVERRISKLKGLLKGRVEVRPTSARWAWVEHRLAQAGVEGADAALRATRAGGTYGDWRRAFAAVDAAG